MVSKGERLRAERERLGYSQAELATLAGQSRETQGRYESDKRAPDWNYLDSISTAGADISFILTGERSAASLPSTAARAAQDHFSDAADFAPVPVHEASLAAGDGSDTGQPEEIIAHLAFRRDWLRRIGVSPAMAVVARAKGDSMEPTIHDGDIVLIDRARFEPPSKPRDPTDHRPVPIYALLDEGSARIKRIDLAAPGTLALLSDNPASPPQFRPAAGISIIGRVVWWGHTNRE